MLSTSSLSQQYTKTRKRPLGFQQQQTLHGRIALLLVCLGIYMFAVPLVTHYSFLSRAAPERKAIRVSNYIRRHSSDVLILSLHNIGDIRIVLRPEWSAESAQYVQRLVVGQCQRCQLYRAEKPGILQGILAAAPDVPLPPIKGTCPAGAEHVHNECPPWDKECGCHGPVMERGYVAWAAGKTGPDFFIDLYPKPAVWWGTQHTVWGEITDPASLLLIDEYIFSLPTHKQEGLTMLDEPIQFELLLEHVE
ncbi:hypothetical protein FisN_26Hh115 [Fistulifera solaris]|uniref:Peptidylprolyl isomerase n=1 Tax=Fistulifera solaris TaxID=1519565 RepID=A0A1Z5JXS8_FISSO|nr:hypothetical protein FisN_26Hh115 [Fistulifera solaris]|eukprot:GAX18814.1 hypothetical protein FisN_26Hh115 [Fistulifera solaris]